MNIEMQVFIGGHVAIACNMDFDWSKAFHYSFSPWDCIFQLLEGYLPFTYQHFDGFLIFNIFIAIEVMADEFLQSLSLVLVDNVISDAYHITVQLQDLDPQHEPG